MGRRSRRLANPFLDYVGTRDAEYVLDVGCGTGHLAAAVMERSVGATVHGIDIAPVYIDCARSRNPHPRLEFQVGDACALTYPDRLFDRVLSLLTRPGELAAARRSAGFVDVAETVLHTRMEYATFACYWAPYLGRDGPGAKYVASLSVDERGPLERAVRAAYVDGEPDGPGSCAAMAWAVKGVAQRRRAGRRGA